MPSSMRARCHSAMGRSMPASDRRNNESLRAATAISASSPPRRTGFWHGGGAGAPPPCRSVRQQLLAQVQAEKPSCVAFGADGAPMTLPFESMRSICSAVTRLALAPFVLAEVNAGLLRFGSAAKPALVPSSSGVSSIHSAVACVELYGMVCLNVQPFVVSWSVTFQTFELGTVPLMPEWMWSPGLTGLLMM